VGGVGNLPPLESANDVSDLLRSGREDLNLRHSAPKCAAGSPEGVAGRSSPSQPSDFVRRAHGAGVQGAQALARFRRDFAAPVLQSSWTPGVLFGGRDALLTVRDVAATLGVCAATVYRLVAEGQLAHVRVLNAIRVAPRDLEAFVDRRRRPEDDRG
jgi:excisionase family DNA binding protein